MRAGAFELGDRKSFGRAAGVSRAISLQRTVAAARFQRPASRCPQIHHCLNEVAGTVGGCDRLGKRFNLTALWSPEPEQTRNDPSNIGVHRGRLLAKGDRGDRRRGIGAHARERPQFLGSVRKAAVSRHVAGASNEVAGARIITKAGPFGEYVMVARRSQGFDRRPALDEAFKARNYRRDGGLLQHDFAQPNTIGIGAGATRRRSPRQAPEVIHIMLKQARRGVGGHHGAMAC